MERTCGGRTGRLRGLTRLPGSWARSPRGSTPSWATPPSWWGRPSSAAELRRQPRPVLRFVRAARAPVGIATATSSGAQPAAAQPCPNPIPTRPPSSSYAVPRPTLPRSNLPPSKECNPVYRHDRAAGLEAVLPGAGGRCGRQFRRRHRGRCLRRSSWPYASTTTAGSTASTLARTPTTPTRSRPSSGRCCPARPPRRPTTPTSPADSTGSPSTSPPCPAT